MDSYKSLIKDTSVYGLAAVLPRVITFILTAVFTTALTTKGFSDQTNWFIYAAFINAFLSMGMETSFFRFYNLEENKSSIIHHSFSIILVNTVAFSALGLLFAATITKWSGFDDQNVIKILILTTVLDAWAIIPLAIIRVTHRPWKYLLIKCINVVVYFILTFIFLIYLPKQTLPFSWAKYFYTGYSPGVFHIVLANFVASALTILLLVKEFRSIRFSFDKDIWHRMLQYGLPIMIGGIAFIVNENFDKLYISQVLGSDINGIYSASYRLGVFMTLYITAFRLGAEPFFFNVAKDADAKTKYKTVMHWFILLGSLLMVAVMIFIDVIADILLRQQEYKQGLIIVPILLLANLFSGIYINLSIWYKLTNRTSMGMYISIFGAMLTIVSLMIFVPIFGYIGGAYATLFTYSFMAVISYLLGKKYYPVPYDLWKAGWIIGVSSALSFVSFHLFRGNYLLNSIIFIGYVGFLWKMEGEGLKRLMRG
ncbi:MAG: oligosaccharide flippase family protein [Lewinellaceae bacterium]|nr:oligosaccharide flippase family protein [Lewinellaceae bacterium]